MSLNIKNPRVHRLAREAAQVTGKTQTGAIEEALERLLTSYGADPQRIEREQERERITQIVDWFWNAPSTDTSIQRIEDLYDEETGLPV